MSGKLLRDCRETSKECVFHLLQDLTMLITWVSSIAVSSSCSVDVPSPPENITIDGVWSRGVSLTWTPSRMDGNSLITEYIIQFWKEASLPSMSSSEPSISSRSPSSSFNLNGQQHDRMSGSLTSISSRTHNSRLNEEEVSSSVTSHVIRDKLSPGTNYAMRMMSKNRHGRGSFSPVVHFTTKSWSQTQHQNSCQSLPSRVTWKADCLLPDIMYIHDVCCKYLVSSPLMITLL